MGVIKQATFLAGMALALGVTVLPPAAGWAQSMSGNPMVTGNIIRDFARITFYWPEKIDMSASANGNKLMVRFDRPVNPDFGEILRSMYPYITKAELTGNQRTIIFTMKEAYKIRSFITDSESGVDILGIYEPAPPVFAEPPKQVKPAERPVEKPAAKPAETPAAKPVVKPAPPAPKPEPKPKPAPKPEKKPAPAAPVVEVQEKPVAPPPRPLATAKPEITAPAPAVATPVPVPVPIPAPQAVAKAPVQAGAIMQPLQKLGAITGERVKVEATSVDNQATLRFDFKEPVAAALWQRDRTVMVWFAKPTTITGLDGVLAKSSSWLTHASQLGGSDFTLLQLDLLTDVQLTMQKDREGYGWQASVSITPVQPEKSILAQVIKTSGSPHVFLPATQAADIVTITDPQIGDTLSVIPLYTSSNGVFPLRSFVDFDILQTAQGIVVAPKSDHVRIEKLPDGIHILAEDGLFLTENISPEEVANTSVQNRDDLFKVTLFPYREWKVDNMVELREREAYLLYQITTTPDAAIRNESRMKLAQLYLAHAMYNEANAVLNRIRREDLDFYRAHKLAALEGASYLLNYRLQEAALSLSSDTLDNNEEGELLRKAVAAAMQPDTAEAVPYLHYNAAYIRQHPPALRQRLALIAANHAIQKGDLGTPTDIFETLEEDKLSSDVANYVDFMKANIAAASGRIKDAEAIWEKQASMVDDRQFRARSAYSQVLMELKEGTLDPKEAIKKLDALRIVWRGDDLERSLLMVLGQLNVNLGNYWDGMKAWEELLEYYPNSPDALQAYQRLADTFRTLYLHDGAKTMDKVKALALYSEFQELTPLGADGNRMIQNMVDHLVASDLLDQAAARLENQVEYRLKDEEKSRVGARLAVIYLLNREPEKALEALRKSRVENAPPGLSLERNRVAAQALIDLGHSDQALAMIEGDFSTDGENVRLEAYWKKEDWAYAIDIIELLLRSRKDLNAPFDAQEGQKLLQLALAYIFMGEFDQLRYIREAYAPLMENNPYKAEFLFLTEDRIETTSENFAKVIENISAMESFMDSYRDRLKKTGLSETVANSENEATDEKAPENPQ